MKSFLQEIVKLKRKEIDALKTKKPITYFVDSKSLLRGVRSFRETISTGGHINLIAEIKKNSPSRKKSFFKNLDIPYLTKEYAENNAKAISVLTDKRFFGGDISHINIVRNLVNLPVLRKDFIIDEYQIYESRYFGADAVLLIARILNKDELKSFMYLAKRIGMDTVVEVHSEEDLEKASSSDAKIIGINNRDLDTFKVDLDTTFRLAPKLPKEIVKIRESGIRTNEDTLRLRKLGVDAVLIGSSFLEAKDIGRKIREKMEGT